MNFVEICNVCTRKAVIKAAKRILNSDKICRSYCDFYFGITFFGTQSMYTSNLTYFTLVFICEKLHKMFIDMFVRYVCLSFMYFCQKAQFLYGIKVIVNAVSHI